MNSHLKKLFLALCLAGAAQAAVAADFTTRVAMIDKGASTYYVPAHIEGIGDVEMMVDTGSGYITINEETLATLKAQGKAHYVKDLVGVLANGSKMVVNVYRISALNIGNSCWVRNVEAAVFPGKTRFILGLSALVKAAPFIFSIDPPQLALSNCGPKPNLGQQAAR